MYKLISFDLQGTLSDSSYSDEFWLELLPILYAEFHNESVQQAKQHLRAAFQSMGKYDRRYYCAKHWVDELCPGKSLAEVFSRLTTKPFLYPEAMNIVHQLASCIPLIIVSTTTHDFINVELSDQKIHFKQVYSTLDDFQIAGKKPVVFEQIAKSYALHPDEILHIGDCAEMDIANAAKAGWQTCFIDKKLPVSERFSELITLLNKNGFTVRELIAT